jgi:hypothetical protein
MRRSLFFIMFLTMELYPNFSIVLIFLMGLMDDELMLHMNIFLMVFYNLLNLMVFIFTLHFYCSDNTIFNEILFMVLCRIK